MTRFWRGVFSLAAFFVVLATVGSLVQASAADAPIRILALGDSITAGVSAGGGASTEGGYRGTLGTMLSHNGINAQFVGTRHDYSTAITNREHDGWPGYVLRSFPADPGPGQLYGALTRNAMTREKPDVILLMAGTNDLIRLTRNVPGYTMPDVLESMNLLLGEIFGIDPQVRVIVAPVVASPIISTADLTSFNSGLAPIVASYAIRGAHITLAAGMADAVPRDSIHFPDTIHPSGGDGYGDVARVWLTALEQVSGQQPVPVAAKQ